MDIVSCWSWMFPPSRMAEGSQAISPSFCRRFAWSQRRSRRHDVIPRETSSLLTVASVDTFPVGLCMILSMNVHLERTKVFLCLCFPNQTRFANSGEQDPIQMLVYLSLPPSEGDRRSAALGATGKMIKSCLIQENKSASRYLCWLHLYAHSKFLMWTTGASERIVCIKLEIRDLGINGRLDVPSCWAS